MGKEALNIYELSRSWFDFCFVNTDIINPAHTAIFFFAIEHCNRLGWKQKFGFPTSMVMEATGIKKHQTYIKYFNDICEWGFFKLVQKSQNQYSANIICLQSAKPKNGKALDKALIKHRAKQGSTTGQSDGQSADSIDIQDTSIPINKDTILYRPFKEVLTFPFSSEEFVKKWDAWRRHLFEIKKPYQTFSSEQGALQFLEKYDEKTATEIIEKSIRNNWKNLREPENNGKSTNTKGHSQEPTGTEACTPL